MLKKLLGFLLVVGCAFSVPACSGDDADATGSAECCKARHICTSCTCSSAQEKTGLEDHKHSCQLVLDEWQGAGCVACEQSGCLSGC